MVKIDKKRIGIWIKKILIIQDGKSFILKKDLENMNFNSEEIKYAIKFIEEIGVNLVDYEITKNNRPSLVCDYEYGDISEYNLSHLDMPLYANLEYNDNGDLIYSDFTEFNEYIEKQFIPNHVFKDENTGDYVIRLNYIVEHQFCEEEVKYLMDYLKNKEILVRGNSHTFCGEFDNYFRTSKSGNQVFRNKINSDLVTKKLKEYKDNPSIELRNEIIILNSGLVISMTKLLSSTVSLSVDELESYGYEGLIDAIDKYDFSYGCKFSTFASVCMKWSIIEGIAECLGFGKGNLFNKYYIAKRIVEKEMCSRIEDDVYLIDKVIEVMLKRKNIPCNNRDYYKRKFFMLHPDNLDKYIDDYNLDNDYIDDNLQQDNLLSLEITDNLVSPVILEGFKVLSEKELTVIRLHYGFDNNICINFREIGDILNLSRERVRQIHNEAISKLRNLSKIQMLEDYVQEYDSCNYNPNPIVAYQDKKI